MIAMGGDMKLSTTLLTLSVLAAGSALAEPVAPSDVQFDDYGAVTESLTGQAGDPAKGAEVLSKRSLGNCVACHQVSALPDVPFQGNIGPMLDGVGDRWNEAELRGIVSDAKKTYPGTMMPSYYRVDDFIRVGNAYTGKAAEGALDPLLTAQQIEDVVAFLVTLKD